MKTKPLYQKLIPPAISTVILGSLVILSTDPIMAFIMGLTTVFNAWVTVMVIQDHYEELRTVKQITVTSHQELRYYAGSATVVFNSTLCVYYNRVPHDPSNPIQYADNDCTVIIGYHTWIRSSSQTKIGLFK